MGPNKLQENAWSFTFNPVRIWSDWRNIGEKTNTLSISRRNICMLCKSHTVSELPTGGLISLKPAWIGSSFWQAVSTACSAECLRQFKCGSKITTFHHFWANDSSGKCPGSSQNPRWIDDFFASLAGFTWLVTLLYWLYWRRLATVRIAGMACFGWKEVMTEASQCEVQEVQNANFQAIVR